MTDAKIRWDDAAIAVVDAVLALGMGGHDARAEIARRLGLAVVTDKQLRNAFERKGRRLSFARSVGSAAHVPTSCVDALPPLAELLEEAHPPTHRSERVPTTVPPQPPAPSGRVEQVAPRLRVAIVGHDLHIPLMSPVWFDLFKQVAIGAGADTIILNGDVLDCEALGSYPRRPHKTADFADEIDACNDFLDEVGSWGIKNLEWADGNHGQGRWQRFIAEKAPQLDSLISLEKLLRLEERGWRLTDYKDHLFFGSCLLSHELGRGGRHAAARTKEDVHGDVAIGHVHRCSVEWRGDVMGKVFFGATFGWGADVSAAHYTYKAHVAATHVLGFGLLTLDEETGQTFVEPVPIVNGRCVARGKLYVSRVPVPTVNKRVA